MVGSQGIQVRRRAHQVRRRASSTCVLCSSLFELWMNHFKEFSGHNRQSCFLLNACLRCQSENKATECVVVWGECNHSFHFCCMSLWVKQNNRCPLCQQDWAVQRVGK
ncbi:unnamed protein product [Darwinula stevensoni]|uniref:RING-type domain-containing protein n=1 Tax=Darwinula stevensoni TaxID=69355 RepID=A0A7R8XCA1_9CRUS|nr:unnamed protein product [Darwinula stevensoni]CAG0891793.1 unnamed protein product [Darwinula stevensoni]